MSSKRSPQTAAKREREQAKRERRERKQAKKVAAAAERSNPTPATDDIATESPEQVASG